MSSQIYKSISWAIFGSWLMAFVAFSPYWLQQVAEGLVKQSNLQKADLIIVLSGLQVEKRVIKASQLYHQGIAKKILMSGSKVFHTSVPHLMRDFAEHYGVEKKDISLEMDSHSTYENALLTYQKIKNLPIKNVIVVTSKFHSARAFRVFNKVFKGMTVRIVAADDGIDYQNWYKHHEMQETILQEWAKTWVYWFKY